MGNTVHFDDRLATVLHHRAAGERAARVQYRQLLDLLGRFDEGEEPELASAAHIRLAEIAPLIPVAMRENVAAEASGRISNPRLLAHLSEDEPRVALAALSGACLRERQWQALIPEMPVRARGLLRHRRDLPTGARHLLDRLGVQDRALPQPSPPLDRPDLDLGEYSHDDYVLANNAVDGQTDPAPPVSANADLGALVRRIEDFQRARARRKVEATPAPANNAEADGETQRITAFLFTADRTARIDWAEGEAARWANSNSLADIMDRTGDAPRQPVQGVAWSFQGEPPLRGIWIIDASPRFDPETGHFLGYIGRCRRPVSSPDGNPAAHASDRVRQLLHELRTPVTAIQGFAEVIQQQTMGPVPHAYRALAAEIAADAARMLACFTEIERLAQLQAGTTGYAIGSCDFVAMARLLVFRLQTVLAARGAVVDADWHLDEAIVSIPCEAAESIGWRFLGAVVSAAAPGERIRLSCGKSADSLLLSAWLPADVVEQDTLFDANFGMAAGSLAATGLLGIGFALRLARAEARVAGGDLRQPEPGKLVLSLPLHRSRTAIRADASSPARAND